MLKLSDLKLIEAAPFSIDYDQGLKATAQGDISLNYGDVNVEAGGLLPVDQSKALIVINASPEVKGTTVTGNETVDIFRLKISFRLIYAYDKKLDITPDFLNENRWFFESQIRASFKNFSEDIMKNTTVNNMKLPF